MEGVIAGSSVISSLATTSYYGQQSGCTAGLSRGFKKCFMKNAKAIIIADAHKDAVCSSIYSVDKNVSLIDLEKVFLLSFNKDTQSSIKKMKVTNNSAYVALCIKSLRQLLLRHRLAQGNKVTTYCFVSSMRLAEKLEIGDITSFVATDGALRDLCRHDVEKVSNYYSQINTENDVHPYVKYYESLISLQRQVKGCIGEGIKSRPIVEKNMSVNNKYEQDAKEDYSGQDLHSISFDEMQINSAKSRGSSIIKE